MDIGANKELGKQVKTLGVRKPFLCTDKGIPKAGITEQLIKLIKEDVGVDSVVFDGTVPNPTDTNVQDALDVFKGRGCDLIISLGGGSSHDRANGVSIAETNGGSVGTASVIQLMCQDTAVVPGACRVADRR
jgi:alcohol dehydrogenase